MSHATKAELHSAYVWDCDNCGRENFVRSVTVEMNPDDPDDAELIAVAREETGHLGDVTGFWQMAPEHVKCPHCLAEFDTNATELGDIPDA